MTRHSWFAFGDGSCWLIGYRTLLATLSVWIFGNTIGMDAWQHYRYGCLPALSIEEMLSIALFLNIFLNLNKRFKKL